MSTPAFTSTDAFRASSALLRERSAGGCPIASAEVERRTSKGKGGYVRECLRRGSKSLAKGKSGSARQHDTIKGVRAEFDARMTRVESTLGDVIAAVSSANEAVNELSSRVSARMAA